MDLLEKKDKNSYRKKNEITSGKLIITTEDNKDNKEYQDNKKQNIYFGDNYITLRTKEYTRKISVIEVKLPNPYLNIDRPERNKTIDYRIKSKFKSAHADYMNHSFTNDTSLNKNNMYNDKYFNSKIISNKIHFTNTKYNEI